MRIACLAWGSLVWDTRDLAIASCWHEDGPDVPVEFARQSADQRLTLVLGETFEPVPSLWACMDDLSLSDAIESLRRREGTVTKRIGVWHYGEDAPQFISRLPDWSAGKHLDAVIWTALPPKFEEENERVPLIEEALEYLRSINPRNRQKAEEYVRRAPFQVRTPYRTQFEKHLGWFPI